MRRFNLKKGPRPAHFLIVIVLLLTASFACSFTGGVADDIFPGNELGEGASPMPEATPSEEAGPTRIPPSACERIPNVAVVAFLYDLPVPTIVSEQEANGVYCRFETIDLEGSAGDLGRSRAVATIKLWDSVEACMDVEPQEEASFLDSPPAPWQSLRVVTWPDKPELIVLITGFDGDHCLTVSAPDISSQPLEHWLSFMDQIAVSLKG